MQKAFDAAMSVFDWVGETTRQHPGGCVTICVVVILAWASMFYFVQVMNLLVKVALIALVIFWIRSMLFGKKKS